MIGFHYHNPVRLSFGRGTFDRLTQCLLKRDEQVLLVTGRGAARRLGYLDRAVEMLRTGGVEVSVYDQVPPNPTDETVREGAELARRHQCDLIVALGGGSSMDAAKGIAVAATHDFPIREFLLAGEHGGKRVPTAATLPVVCVTTTAGTSSELTPFAVITATRTKEKSSIAGDCIYPRASICDPDLTLHVPPEVTAATGVDVLCHAMEGYISTAAGPLTDAAAVEAIGLVGRYLPQAVEHGDDIEARYHMSLANAFAGLPLSNCGASVMHGLEHPVSAHYPEVPHGAGLAALLVAYCTQFHGQMPEKFARVSALLGGPERAEAAADTVRELLDRVGLNIGLSRFGVDRALLPELADDALRYMGGAVSKTPGCVGRECLVTLLEASFGR